MAMTQAIPRKVPLSKPYQRTVHFQQRIAQYLGIDPKQSKAVVRAVEAWIQDNSETLPAPELMGIRTMSLALKQLGLSSKISSHWIQLRNRIFGDVRNCIPGALLKRVKMRYFCISNAFDRCLRKSSTGGDTGAGNGTTNNSLSSPCSLLPSTCTESTTTTAPVHLFRNNIINLNYTIVQLARLESEELFQQMAPYFPQLYSQYQPRVNNQRWRKLIDYCQLHYRNVADPVHGDMYGFDWDKGYRVEVWEEGEGMVTQTVWNEIDLNALTQEDLLRYFFYFQ